MLKQGDKLPEPGLADQTGETRTLGDLTGPKGLVLYVYSKDNTSGCTAESEEFQHLADDFDRLGFHVAGISKDTSTSHANFAAKKGLSFPLLADPEKTYLDALGAWVEKKSRGKVSMGAQRSTFVARPDGTLIKVYPKVKAKGHAAQVLTDLGELAG